MHKGVFGFIVAALLTRQAASVYVRATPADQAPVAAPAAPPAASLPTAAPAASAQRALITRYCVGCHNERTRSGNLALDAIDVADVTAHPQVWEKVIRKVGAGLMPPAGRPRPD